eukprot:766715-Hanusia_phi.AAC.12
MLGVGGNRPSRRLHRWLGLSAEGRMNGTGSCRMPRGGASVVEVGGYPQYQKVGVQSTEVQILTCRRGDATMNAQIV